MTASFNRSFTIKLIIVLLFLTNVFCLPETVPPAQPTTRNIITPTESHESFVPNLPSNAFERKDRILPKLKDDSDDDDEREKYRKSERGKKKDIRKSRFDDKSGRKYNKHEDSVGGDSDSDDDDDDDDDKKDRKSTPSNTVVTTIIIVATETPTSIYSGTVNPAKQKGTGSTGHQVSDPNSSSSEGNDQNEPSETALTEQLYKDQSSYHKLVLALSIVGGLAGIGLLTGLLIFARMRIRKRKRKQADLEKADSNDMNTPASPPSPPTHHSPPPPPRARFSTLSDDGDSTVIEFNQNPFLDPTTTFTVNKNVGNDDSVTVLPNAPPTLPVHLEPRRYSDYRQNRTLSMISQTAGTTLPSAPPAKELDGISKYENPFEDEYGSSQRYAVLDENENEIHESPLSSPILRPSSAPQRPSQTSSFSSDLPPPPAYTPSAAPSAPPLYALPTGATFIAQQQPEDDSSRRHSISSCSMISTNRPLSLRRGSGSPAHISSPFS